MFHFNKTIDLSPKKLDLLTFGEILIDMIADDCDDKDTMGFHGYFGGSPSNIAMNCSQLGLKAATASAVGNDRLGRYLRNCLLKQGLKTDLIQVTDYPTSMVLLNRTRGTPIPVFYRGADYRILAVPSLEHRAGDTKIFHFSYWPVSKEPSREVLTTLLKIAKESKALICFDPNYHPALSDSEEIDHHHLRNMFNYVDIVKPSEDDAARIFGAGSPEVQIGRFLEWGVKLVILTLGKDGLIASNGIETVALPSLANVVMDTTGAGDAFWSGFYTALIQGDTIADALIAGSSVCACKLESVGAITQLPSLSEIVSTYGMNIRGEQPWQ